MKKSTQLALISVAVVVGLTTIIAAGTLFMRMFSDVLHFENDSSDTVTITLLLENHDDNRFYLFDDRTIAPDTTDKISLDSITFAVSTLALGRAITVTCSAITPSIKPPNHHLKVHL